MTESKKTVDNYYDAVARRYHEPYEMERLYDLSAPYPANYFRLQLLLNSLILVLKLDLVTDCSLDSKIAEKPFHKIKALVNRLIFRRNLKSPTN